MASTQSDKYQTAKELFAGSVGGIVQVLTGQPFDTVKVRLQTQSVETPLYSGVGDCVTKTLKNEGLSGFYKGTLTPLLGIGGCVSIQFGALEYMKRYFQEQNKKEGKNGHLSLTQLYLSGAASGTANSILSGPIEHIRTRLQVQSSGPKLYHGPVDFVKKVSSQFGIFSVYKGQAITVVREFTGYGIYFMTYEWLMQRNMAQNNLKRSEVSSLSQLLYGAVSGYTLWTFIYPIDVIKSKLQTDSFDRSTAKYNSSLDCLRKTIASDGFRGLYRGFVPCMLRAGPVNAATFAAYEVTMNLIGR